MEREGVEPTIWKIKTELQSGAQPLDILSFFNKFLYQFLYYILDYLKYALAGNWTPISETSALRSYHWATEAIIIFFKYI